MSSQGSVCGMNPNTGRVVVRTEGGYTVMDIERGSISGPGRAILINTSRESTEVTVRVEVIDAALEVARALLHEDEVETDVARGCAEGSGTA
jgi:hypothetical protein